MTFDEVVEAVRDVERLKNDDESAHSAEDGLWCSVLEAIANGADNPRALASEALKTLNIDFSRWCA